MKVQCKLTLIRRALMLILCLSPKTKTRLDFAVDFPKVSHYQAWPLFCLLSVPLRASIHLNVSVQTLQLSTPQCEDSQGNGSICPSLFLTTYI